MAPNSFAWIPTRLLEIVRQSADDILVRISENKGNGTDSHEPYITLSHRWGNVPTNELRKANIQDYMRGVSLTTLPRTYQDAVEICGWFEVRFLWIDSLCIIQDCNEDWAEEAMQMHQVYSNAMLNIAASCARNSESGCFMHRVWGFGKPVPLHLPRGRIFLIPEVDFLAASITNGPLAQRGWVLQEQLLARRVLYFGEQLFWECTETWACEALPDGKKDSLALLGDPSYLSIRRMIDTLAFGSGCRPHYALESDIQATKALRNMG